MVLEIELSDEQGEHIEVKSDGSARLFGRGEWDKQKGCFTVTARQLNMLRTILDAQSKMLEALR